MVSAETGQLAEEFGEVGRISVEDAPAPEDWPSRSRTDGSEAGRRVPIWASVASRTLGSSGCPDKKGHPVAFGRWPNRPRGGFRDAKLGVEGTSFS
jgi:hypothetical protein